MGEVTFVGPVGEPVESAAKLTVYLDATIIRAC